MLLVSEALQTGSKDKEEKANVFIRLCDMEWSNEVSTTALSTLRMQKLNKVTIVPLSEDITKMQVSKMTVDNFQAIANPAESEVSQHQSLTDSLDKLLHQTRCNAFLQCIFAMYFRLSQYVRLTLINEYEMQNMYYWSLYNH